LIQALAIRAARRVVRHLWRFTEPLYNLACRTGIFRILLPPWWRQRVLTISVENRPTYSVMIGKRRVGRYDAVTQQWIVPARWRLFVDEGKLPRFNDSDQS
jgi:hypothetical protein